MRPILDEVCALLGVASFMKIGTMFSEKSSTRQAFILNLSNNSEKLISEFQRGLNLKSRNFYVTN